MDQDESGSKNQSKKELSGWSQIQWWAQKILPTLIPSLIALVIGAYLNFQVENQKRESEARIAQIQAETEKDILEKQLYADAERRALDHYLRIVNEVDGIIDNPQLVHTASEITKVADMIRDLRLYDTKTLKFVRRLAERAEIQSACKIDRGAVLSDTLMKKGEDAARPAGNDIEDRLKKICDTLHEELYNSISTIKFHISNASFRKKSLRNIDLRNSVISNTSFVHSGLFNADFSDSDFLDVDFSNADLQNANFQNTRLRNTSFDRARVQNADFTGARIRDLNLLTASGVDQAIIPAHLLAGPIFSYRDLAALLEKHKSELLETQNERVVCFMWGRYHELIEMKEPDMLAQLAEANKKDLSEYMSSELYSTDEKNPQTALYKNLIRAHFQEEGWTFEIATVERDGEKVVVGRCTREGWTWHFW
ncbi:MAG: pentapeptide repeat-containing protein [Pseudomonadota bacterium]